jgi:hypothetical protein
MKHFFFLEWKIFFNMYIRNNIAFLQQERVQSLL